MKNKKGFTLVELLAVIVVLAILALLAGNTVGDMISKSKWNAFKTDALNIAKAAEDYYALQKLEGTATGSYSCTDLKTAKMLNLDKSYTTCNIIVTDSATTIKLTDGSFTTGTSGATKSNIANDTYSNGQGTYITKIKK